MRCPTGIVIAATIPVMMKVYSNLSMIHLISAQAARPTLMMVAIFSMGSFFFGFRMLFSFFAQQNCLQDYLCKSVSCSIFRRYFQLPAGPSETNRGLGSVERRPACREAPRRAIEGDFGVVRSAGAIKSPYEQRDFAVTSCGASFIIWLSSSTTLNPPHRP